MGFADRSRKSARLVELLNRHFRERADVTSAGLFHQPYGYETHIAPEAQEVLKRIYTDTAKHIRFTPDHVVVSTDTHMTDPVILMEYKVTTTPRYTLGERQWDAGQIEADAWDNYMNLVSAGIKTAVCIWCPYHARPLLCDFPDEGWLTQERTRVRQTGRGSGTPYVNISLTRLRPFTAFMKNEFGAPPEISGNAVRALMSEARQDPLLQTTHGEASGYRDRQTGFNWTDTSSS